MKLCAMVFEFHHTPTAISGAAGQRYQNAVKPREPPHRASPAFVLQQSLRLRMICVYLHQAIAQHVTVGRLRLFVHLPYTRRARPARPDPHYLLRPTTVFRSAHSLRASESFCPGSVKNTYPRCGAEY